MRVKTVSVRWVVGLVLLIAGSLVSLNLTRTYPQLRVTQQEISQVGNFVCNLLGLFEFLL